MPRPTPARSRLTQEGTTELLDCHLVLSQTLGMITWLALWSVAAAAPETVTLDNGVRIVVDAAGDGSGIVDAGWFSGVGTAHTAPGATATALMSLHLGTTSVPEDTVVTTWVSTLATVPTPHLCALDAGTTSTIATDGLAAWAWLTSDSLADPTSDDIDRAHSLAQHSFPQVSPSGIDRASSPWAWPAVVPSSRIDTATLHNQRARLADPSHLIVVVRGDTTLERVQTAVSASFSRLPPTDLHTQHVEPAPRTQRVVVTFTGEPEVVIRADIAPSIAARTLVAALNDRVKTALDRDAFDAQVRLDETGEVWTLALHATPSVGRASSIEPAWQAWLQQLAGEGLAPRPSPQRPESLATLAHNILRPTPVDAGAVQAALTELVAAPRTIYMGTAAPEDAELDRIRDQHGELTAELVRIRLRTVAETPKRDLPALIRQLRAERDAVAPRLRPALDLVITHAEARQ